MLNLVIFSRLEVASSLSTKDDLPYNLPFQNPNLQKESFLPLQVFRKNILQEKSYVETWVNVGLGLTDRLGVESDG